ncbi:BNR repeat-containing protein [bacterium]|nr:BNR repeat-containing protein [bacterium]
MLVTFSVVGAGAWVIETVDSGSGYRGCHSLVLDSLDHPNISYFGVTGLKFARWDGSDWQIETVDSSIDSVLDTSLALDSLGNPHIAYRAFTTSDDTHSFKYARWDGTTWQIETLSTADHEYFTSLTLDSTDRPHIAYLAGSGSYQLMYATRNDTGWIFEAIDSAGHPADSYSKPSLAIDSIDNPHISYFDHVGDPQDPGYIKYAYRDGSTWHTEAVFDTIYSAKTCIALNTSNNPSIIATHFAGESTYHHMIEGHWYYEYPGFSTFHSPSLALDSLNSPHVTYKDYDGEYNLSYAHKIGSFGK